MYFFSFLRHFDKTQKKDNNNNNHNEIKKKNTAHIALDMYSMQQVPTHV